MADDEAGATVPAGLAIQCRESDFNKFARFLHGKTGIAVTLERASLRTMEGGCRTAFAVHYADGCDHLFYEDCGHRPSKVHRDEAAQGPEGIAMAILKENGLRQ
jgi:porphobilinogen deaminase